MLPEGVARHWKMKLFSVFLLNLMSFPILQVRLQLYDKSSVFLGNPKGFTENFQAHSEKNESSEEVTFLHTERT